MAKLRLRAKSRVSVSLCSIVRHFESLPDPRHHRNRRHLLVEIITIAVCGMIVGCEGPTSMQAWAKAKADWLTERPALPHGVPSRDCIRRVLTALKPAAFQACFESWIISLMGEDVPGNPIVAIDGKTMRRSHDHKNGLGPLHLVSAWATNHGLSLGQVATEEKSNEIKMIPEPIDRIDVRGGTVTIDAMGCQKQIAKKIIDAGAITCWPSETITPSYTRPSRRSSATKVRRCCARGRTGFIRAPRRVTAASQIERRYTEPRLAS